jgi:hypothetical protein
MIWLNKKNQLAKKSELISKRQKSSFDFYLRLANNTFADFILNVPFALLLSAYEYDSISAFDKAI